jgi:hypothetical protein
LPDTTQLEESILRTLQTAFDADPCAMRALTVNRVPCNQAMADHPSVVVAEVPLPMAANNFEVGMIGVIVGLMCDAGCKRVVGWKFEEVPGERPEDRRLKFAGFSLVERTCASAS